MDHDTLAKLVGQLTTRHGETLWLWMTTPGGWHLGRPKAEPLPLDVVEGRLFRPSGELRWRRLGEHPAAPLRVTWLGEAGDAVAAALPTSVELRSEAGIVAAQRQSVVLWGRQLAGEPGLYVEQQIPHRLRYPVALKGRSGRVALSQERLLDARGQVQLCRWVALTPFGHTTPQTGG